MPTSLSCVFLAFLLIPNALSSTVIPNDNFPDNCDSNCQASISAALTAERAQWISPNISADPLYRNPTNLSDYAAGDVVKWEDVPSENYITVSYDTPPATMLSKFLYMSEDISGNPIPASAFLLLPFTNQDGNGKPLRTVVWTHGTAGVTRQCAPSNNKRLYYEWEGPFALVQQGYAVIAPDYAGQGSDIPMGFMYESGALHALDVSFALQAVRSKLHDRITHEWVIVGHSEGGMTAWRVNEREKRNATGGFLGAVSGAPALRPLSLIPQSWRLAGDGPVHDSVSIFVLQSISRLFPSVKVDDYVSDIVASRIPIAQQGCLASAAVIYGNLTLSELYKNTSWIEHPDVIEWQNRYNGAGTSELAAPMMVLQGTADELVYTNLTEWDYDQTCGSFASSAVQLYIYPDLNHDFAFIAGQAQYLPWIRDRFDKVVLTPACNKTTVTLSSIS
ncbi:Alpha/Beta hydrolase protein [Aspergillus leporis]|jgi:alpha-beta hydrolase superfamily lysophospholipase|uniref:Alpha/Beta hydrolase protein n=1 Tax=Aspergillus leporis TaxID=41062 RepID=A0A5N5WGM8_9EURO|nr:Alpha/Beta hydrolase protein [Aspergillus leporis]